MAQEWSVMVVGGLFFSLVRCLQRKALGSVLSGMIPRAGSTMAVTMGSGTSPPGKTLFHFSKKWLTYCLNLGRGMLDPSSG